MNTTTIINDEMTLDQKLAAIDEAIAKASADIIVPNINEAPVDPASLLICEGCQ